MSTNHGRVLAAAASLLLACAGQSEAPPAATRVLETEVRNLPTPAAPGSGEPNLAVGPDGRLLLSWIEPDGEGHRLRFASRVPGGAWSDPRDVARGEGWFVNWADFPSMAVAEDGTLFAHWLQRSGPATYAYDVRLTSSIDDGLTWRAPVSPHDDETKTEHGFASLVPIGGDRVSVLWLDGRETAAADGHTGPARMTLRHAVVDSSGEVREAALLDDRVCDCCQTSAAKTPEGVLAVYRDRSEEEIRDIWSVSSSPQGWSPPARIAEDGWEISGCPVNGPSVGTLGAHAVVAWFGAPEDRRFVHVAFSEDGGQTWGEPIPADTGRPIGRVDVVLLSEREAVVSWMEQVEGGAEVRVRSVRADGRRGEPVTVADPSAARSSGFPRMERSGDELVVAWRDSGEPPVVRTAVVGLNGR